MKKKIVSMMLASAMVMSLMACGNGNSEPEAGKADPAETEADVPETETLDIYVPDIPEIEGSDAEAEIDIWTYYGGDNTTMAEFAVEQIKKKFPNVTLNLEAYPQDGGQTVKTRAAAGDLPDLLLVDSGTLMTLAKSGNIIPIDDYADEFNIGNYYTDAIMENCLVSEDGHVYQFPIGSISPILWYYNSQLFEDNDIKVPENYEELLGAVKQFRQLDITPMAMFGKEPWPLGAFFDSFAMKNNEAGFYALSTGEAKASDEGYAEAVEKIKELIDEGIFQEGSTNADFDTASALFKSGKAAMILDGSWYTSEAIAELGESLDIMEIYPTGEPGDTTNQYAMSGGGDTNGMAVSDSAEDKDLAAAIGFLFTYYREVAHYETTGLVETPLKVEGLKLDTELDHVSAKLQEVLPNYTFSGKFLHTLANTEFSTTFTEEMQKFIVGESSEEFIGNIDKCIERTVE